MNLAQNETELQDRLTAMAYSSTPYVIVKIKGGERHHAGTITGISGVRAQADTVLADRIAPDGSKRFHIDIERGDREPLSKAETDFLFV